MFQGKVYSYQNINGKEKSFEKTFDSYDEYRSFMWGNSMLSGFLGGAGNIFDSYFNNFFDSRMALTSGGQSSESSIDLPVDMKKYDEEVRKIEMSEREKECRKQQLESAKTRLTEYKTKFESSGKKGLLKDVETDMKKIEEELKSLT